MPDITNEKNIVPTELITNKTLYTLTGASAAVWIVCLVIHSILHKSVNNPDVYKVIALTLSLLISISIVFKKRKKKYEDWLLSVINAFLIFIYATGFNSISSNVFIGEEEKVVSKQSAFNTSVLLSSKSRQLAGVVDFFEIDWFPNKRLIKENKNLKNNVDSLDKIISSISALKPATYSNGNDSLLIKENIELRKKVQEMEKGKTKIAIEPIFTDKDKTIQLLTSEVAALKQNHVNSKPAPSMLKTDYSIDSLKQVINKLASQQKQYLQVQKDVEMWRQKYMACMDNKDVH